MTLAPKTSPKEKATAETKLDAMSLSAIRSILTEEDAPAPRSRFGRPKAEPEREVANKTDVAKAAPVRRKADALPDLASADSFDEVEEAAPMKKRGFSLRRKPAAPKERAPKKQIAPKAPPVKAETPKAAYHGEGGAGLMDRIRAYRPSVAHIVLAAIVLFVVMRPWLAFGLMVFAILVLIGVFLIAGYDGFWHGVVKVSRWYANRRPSRAAALHARLDRFAVRWDAVLDRFPEGTVDGLYLPDFAELATTDARHDEAMERRLAGLQEKGA